MKNRAFLICLVIFTAGITKLGAQNKQLGSWNMLNVRLNTKGHWGGFFEAQARSISFYNNFFYHEAKGVLLYNFSKDFSLGVGTGAYNTYTEGGNFTHPLKQEEIRTWFQLQMRHWQGIVGFEHRYRVEQRFIKTGYRNRFRYRFNIFVPLNKSKIGPGTLYACVSDEVFFTNLAPFFERNRVFGGLGYDFTKAVGVQAGFLRQYDYKLVNPVGRNFLQISLLLNINGARPAGILPSTMD